MSEFKKRIAGCSPSAGLDTGPFGGTAQDVKAIAMAVRMIRMFVISKSAE
jgi:hypothetical protein